MVKPSSTHMRPALIGFRSLGMSSICIMPLSTSKRRVEYGIWPLKPATTRFHNGNLPPPAFPFRRIALIPFCASIEAFR